MAYEQNLTVFSTFGEENSWSLDVYKKHGGYEAWGKVLAGELTPEEIEENVDFAARYVRNVKRYSETFRVQRSLLENR